MLGLIGFALIALGISWRLYQQRVERTARMSRNWVVNDLPTREAEERRRMGMAGRSR